MELTNTGNHTCTTLPTYIDDFLLMGPPQSSMCYKNLEVVKDLCAQLRRYPSGLKKGGQTIRITTFLGITLDTQSMEAHLPADKLKRIVTLALSWLKRKKAIEREILTLVGLLQHATKVVKLGCTFITRMYATAAKVKKLSYYTRLTKEFRSDLQWWHMFLTKWNGISVLCTLYITCPQDHQIQTDASETWGCGAYFNG